MKKKDCHMTFAGTNNLLWVQYSPGAAGRIILICCTTAHNVGNWMSEPLPDPVEYTKTKFCTKDANLHMKTEPQTPYNNKFFTRVHPFVRGDDLTSAQVRSYLMTDPRAVSDLSQGKLLAGIWNKTYLPGWFDGKLLTIVSDDASHKWLMQRRKKLFYKFNNGKAYNIRYMPEFIQYGHIAKKYNDGPCLEYDYKDEDAFVEWHYTEAVHPGSGTNINLSDILSGDKEKLWDTIDMLLEAPVNRLWCNQALDTWRGRWAKSYLAVS